MFNFVSLFTTSFIEAEKNYIIVFIILYSNGSLVEKNNVLSKIWSFFQKLNLKNKYNYVIKIKCYQQKVWLGLTVIVKLIFS